MGNKVEPSNFKILSIDGGGIRGIMPATLLSLIEQETKQPLHRYFDLICGTSTGSIIALALSLGKPMADIAKLYEEKADTIFPHLKNNSFIRKCLFLRKLAYGDGHIYDSGPLEELLKGVFESSQMKDAKTRVCIPSIDITSGRIVVYKTPHKVITPIQKTLGDDADKEMWNVARASSAAPIFFPTAKVRDSYCIDGGMWGNNPSLIGLIEALRMGYAIGKIKILSIGTGSTIYQFESDKAKSMNLEKWGLGTKLIEISFEVQSEAIHNQLNLLLDSQCYMRLDHKFPKSITMTDTSRLGDLKAAAQNLMRDHKHDLMQRFFSDFVINVNLKQEEENV